MERKKEKQMRSKTKLLQKLLLVYLPVETRVNVMYKSQLSMLVYRRSSEGGLVPLNLVGVEVYSILFARQFIHFMLRIFSAIL